MFTEPYIGNVTIFAGTFAPQSWMFCQGQQLSIATYTALFSIIGTTYGGDGQETFNLPDLRGRKAIHAGQGPGLSSFVLGQTGGTEIVTLTANQLPSHSHPFVSAGGAPVAYNGNGNQSAPVANAPAILASGHQAYATASTGTVLGQSQITANVPPITSGGQPFDIRSPYLGLNYIIAVEGIFPSRN